MTSAKIRLYIAREQAHLRVTRGSGEEQSDPAGRSLVKRPRDFAARFRTRGYAACACAPTRAHAPM